MTLNDHKFLKGQFVGIKVVACLAFDRAFTISSEPKELCE